jgi:predicted phage terminase large subunit-like protein
LLRCVQEQADLHCPQAILVEDTSNGTPLAQSLKGGPLNVIAIQPRGDKQVRAMQASPVFESRRVLLPRDAPWSADYQRELLSFPAGRHDDQVDSTTQFIIWAEEKARRKPVLCVAPFSAPGQSHWYSDVGSWRDRN